MVLRYCRCCCADCGRGGRSRYGAAYAIAVGVSNGIAGERWGDPADAVDIAVSNGIAGSDRHGAANAITICVIDGDADVYHATLRRHRTSGRIAPSRGGAIAFR
jgi:hypothetical protein